MDSDQLVLKKVSKIALAALGVLLVLAVVFYKERIFFGDASFILFNIINNKSFGIQEHRYGSFVTQMVPYFGQKLQLPIKAIVIGYAISFNLFYLLVAAFLVRCRQYALAIVMSLYYFLFVSDTFFWTNNEIHQAIAWMFLMFGVTIYLGSKKVNLLLVSISFALLAFFTIFTHFVVIIPTVFLLIYFLIDKKSWPFSAKANIFFACLLAAVIIIKYSLSVKQSYDGRNLYGVTHFSFKDIFNSFSTPVAITFLRRCTTNYWFGVILFVLGIISLFKEKKIALAVWTSMSIAGYFIIMGLTYGEFTGNFPLFHIESEWASISIIVAAPFVFNYLPKLNIRYAATLVICVFLARLVYIGISFDTFRWRTHFKEHIFTEMKRKGITKLGLVNDNYLQSKNILDWAMSEETILLSAVDGDHPQLTFFCVNKDDSAKIKQLLMAKGLDYSFGWVPPDVLNYKYFLIDTAHAYQIMTQDELLK